MGPAVSARMKRANSEGCGRQPRRQKNAAKFRSNKSIDNELEDRLDPTARGAISCIGIRSGGNISLHVGLPELE